MALSIDKATVLRAIADHPDAFPAVQKEISEFTNKVLVRQVKAAKTDLSALRKVCAVAGEENLKTVLDADGFAEKDLKGLIKRVDKYSGLLQGVHPLKDLREHVIALAAGREVPASAPARPSKASPKKNPKATPPASKIGEVLGSEVHSGRARRLKR